MIEYHVSDVAHAIKEGKKLDDLSPIYWACREAEAVASLIAISISDFKEKHDADPSALNLLTNIERAADLIQKRLAAVTDAVDHAEMKIRDKLMEIPAPAEELARVAEAMQAAAGGGNRNKGTPNKTLNR